MIVQALALVGVIALVFGVGARWATGESGTFATLQSAAGAAALVVAALLSLRRLRGIGTAEGRRLIVPRLLWLLATIAAAVALERAVSATGARLDWTADGHFELWPATREALASAGPPVAATHYVERSDPRARRTWLLLESFAEAGGWSLRQRGLAESEDEIERFDVASTNAVVLTSGDRFETVDRPTEGALLEALQRLRGGERRPIHLAAGEGEGDPESVEPWGHSGLATALRNEGYDVRSLVLSAHPEVPQDSAALVVLGPQRALLPEAADAIERFVLAGGRLLAFLEPGVTSGLEPMLQRLGFELPDGVVIDPDVGAVEGGPAGASPVVGTYSQHPVTRGLDERTMSFFVQARAIVAARKPEPSDALGGLAFTSRRAFLQTDLAALRLGIVRVPEDAARQRWPLVAAGSYPRGEREGRVVVFGDADLTTNRYLRALYNLDLVMNALHWAVDRPSRITLRPKLITPDQDPLTPQQTLGMFYGIGLLLPELLLIAAALTWLRTRAG